MPSTKRVSHRGSLLKGVAVYRVLYQSILNAKLTGRKNLGRKRCTSNRDDRKLLLNQRQHQKSLTWAVEKNNWTVTQWSKVLFSDESKFCISFGNKVPESGGRVERHRIHVA